MTHTASHIIIHKLTQPVSFGKESPNTKCRVWWFAALPVVTFVVGLLIG